MANPANLASLLQSFTRQRGPLESPFAPRPDGSGPIGPPPTPFRPGVPFGGFGVPLDQLERGILPQAPDLGGFPLHDLVAALMGAAPGSDKAPARDLIIKQLLDRAPT